MVLLAGCFGCEFVVFVFLLRLFGAQCQDFGYEGAEGPSHWGEKYSQCLGKHQSPIDIETHSVIWINYPELHFEQFGALLRNVSLENNGHTVVMKILSGEKPRIHGGPLKGVYEFGQLHFHWGPNDTIGSENQIDHHSFPLEMHVVMFNTAYGLENAPKIAGGLTVLSFLTSLSPLNNHQYDKFENGLHHVEQLLSANTMQNVGSLDDLTTTQRRTYFTYEGSLTTPPCSEVVTWIEFVKTIPLSKAQVNSFRMIDTKKGRLTHNYRPIQPINDRRIFYQNSSQSNLQGSLAPAMALLAALFLLINT
ncbi:putative carbonic anhydrase 3 [Dendroctonus ponderosae]|uniref:Carbonic anhydrase n=1 Tax=Dendroctonus ponderosae TaxID=77166 RepID=A0AAR5QKZ7_DENPD|nr:putative carbonic anhydrase 3 [Dendroctonus ponderosae]